MAIPEGIEHPLMHISLLLPLDRAKRVNVNFRKKFAPFVPIIGEFALMISAPS